MLMVVDDTDSLQMAIDYHRTYILKTSPLHIFSHTITQFIAYTRFFLMFGIDHCLTIGKAPDIFIECSKLFTHLTERTSIRYHCLYFPLAMYHSFLRRYTTSLIISEGCHLVVVKVSKASPKDLLLLQH